MKVYRCLEDGEISPYTIAVRNEVVEVKGFFNKIKAILMLIKGDGEITIWTD